MKFVEFEVAGNTTDPNAPGRKIVINLDEVCGIMESPQADCMMITVHMQSILVKANYHEWAQQLTTLKG